MKRLIWNNYKILNTFKMFYKTFLKHDYEELGFFLAIDRDRNGNIIRRIERNGPADRAGLS